jgi:peptidoglycan/LPS O-acetylase OafA/YrhL
MTALPAGTPVRFGYNGGLDGLRAVAIAGVILQHGGFTVSGGFQGVTIFFVVSGYLITSLLAAEIRATGRLRFGNFYRRRFARLAPALYVVIVATLIWNFSVATPVGQWWGGAVGAGTYTTDLISGFLGNQAVNESFQFTWTLGIEEQFYLLWPLLLVFLLRSGKVVPLLVVVLGVVLVWVFSTPADVTSTDTAVSAAYQFGPFAHVDALLLGCGIALVLLMFPQTLARRIIAPIVGVAGIVGLVLVFIPTIPWITNPYGVAALAAAGIVFWVAASPRDILGRFLGLLPFRFVGKISYGIYLWNILLVLAFTLIFGELPVKTPWGFLWVVAVLGFGFLSYRFVETPLRKRWAPPQSHAVLAEPTAKGSPLVAEQAS